jgi:hypothetical protein
MSKTRALTPSQALNEALEMEAPADMVARALGGALVADAVNRDGSRSPDHRTRVQAAALILAYKIGRPVERQEVVAHNTNVNQGDDLTKRLIHSPALRVMFRKMLAEAEEGIINQTVV